MISPEFARKYETFLLRYDEPDLRQHTSTEKELQQHIDGIEASRKGAAYRLREAFAGLGQSLREAMNKVVRA